MRSLLYLVLHMAKNQILAVRRKPALLIVYILFIGLLGLSFWGSSSPTANHMPEMGIDIGWFKLAFLGYLCLFAFTSVHAGLAQGASVFEMSDVNFLFGSPVNPKQILVFGLARQAVKSIFASIFILFMGGTLNNFWGITFGGLLLIYAGYVLSLIIFQLISVVIYMYAAGRPKAKMVVGIVAAALLLPLVLSVLLPYLGGTPIDGAVLNAMHGPMLYTLPVVGWVIQGVMAMLGGAWLTAGLCLVLVLAAAAVCLLLLTFGKSDYYEDVLVATETAFQRKQAAADGNLQAADAGVRKVRLSKTTSGDIWGRGPAAFLGKHMLETTRRNRLKIFDASSFSFILTTVIMAFFMRDEGSLVVILSTVMGMRLFLIGTGLGLKELYVHYIYMVPASSFAKIIWSNLETFVKCFAESLLSFLIAGILMGSGAGEIIMSILATSVFAVLLVSVNLLSMRIFANVISQGLLLTFYILFVVLTLAPGIVMAALVGIFSGVVLGLGVLTLWQVLLCALFFFLARGVLHSCDMETAPKTNR